MFLFKLSSISQCSLFCLTDPDKLLTSSIHCCPLGYKVGKTDSVQSLHLIWNYKMWLETKTQVSRWPVSSLPQPTCEQVQTSPELMLLVSVYLSPWPQCVYPTKQKNSSLRNVVFHLNVLLTELDLVPHQEWYSGGSWVATTHPCTTPFPIETHFVLQTKRWTRCSLAFKLLGNSEKQICSGGALGCDRRVLRETNVYLRP